MGKSSVTFVCQTCDATFPRWLGRCTTCQSWDSLVEQDSPKSSKGIGSGPLTGKPLAVRDIGVASMEAISTGIGELDRVLGGGVVPGGVTLIGGDPGIGKSTLLMQALAGLCRNGHKCLYISAEESAEQAASRARRLGTGADDLLVFSENNWVHIENAIAAEMPQIVVIDSVQTVHVPDIAGTAGSVSQLREVASRAVDRAKKHRVATFLVGHVTKDGSLAGPKVLEHLVDTVLAFEGDRSLSFRTLRAQKNRFGNCSEVGVFEMTSEGMREVANPSAFFLAERPREVAGSIIAATCEGTRPILVEVQALVSPFSSGGGRRAATGIDTNRLAMLIAVLERKAGLSMTGCDIFVNVAGGLRIEEPALDLPISMALVSSLRDFVLPDTIVTFGEIGLSGEVRSVPRTIQRLTECSRMGFARAIIPKGTTNSYANEMVATEVTSLVDALAHLRLS